MNSSLKEQICEVLGILDIDEIILDNIATYENKQELKDFLYALAYGLSDKFDEKKIDKFANEFINRRISIDLKTTIVTKELKKKNKEKHKFRRCGCMCLEHDLYNNCVSCAYIMCEVEAQDNCLMCGFNLNHTINDDDYNDAVKSRDRLIDYDDKCLMRTEVYDDSTDWYAESQNHWISEKDREFALGECYKETEETPGVYLMTLDFQNLKFIQEEPEKVKLEEVRNYIRDFDNNKKNVYENNNRNYLSFLDDKAFDIKKLDDCFELFEESVETCYKDGYEVLYVDQPYASLIVNGLRRVECRGAYYDYKGQIWIYANSYVPNNKEIKHIENYYKDLLDINVFTLPQLPINCLLGRVDLIDCITKVDFEDLRKTEIYYSKETIENDFVYLLKAPYKLLVPISTDVRDDFKELFMTIKKGLNLVNIPLLKGYSNIKLIKEKVVYKDYIEHIEITKLSINCKHVKHINNGLYYIKKCISDDLQISLLKMLSIANYSLNGFFDLPQDDSMKCHIQCCHFGKHWNSERRKFEDKERNDKAHSKILPFPEEMTLLYKNIIENSNDILSSQGNQLILSSLNPNTLSIYAFDFSGRLNMKRIDFDNEYSRKTSAPIVYIHIGEKYDFLYSLTKCTNQTIGDKQQYVGIESGDVLILTNKFLNHYLATGKIQNTNDQDYIMKFFDNDIAVIDLYIRVV